MFCQHLFCFKDAITVQHTLGDNSLALAEKIRQEALVGDGNLFDGVRQDELHGQVSIRPLDRAFHNHAT